MSFYQFKRQIPRESTGKYVFFVERDTIKVVSKALETFKGALDSFYEDGLHSREEIQANIEMVEKAIQEWKSEIDAYRINPWSNDN